MNKIFIYIAMLFFFTVNNSIFSMEKEKPYKSTKSFPIIVNPNVKKKNFQKKQSSQNKKNFFGERIKYTHRIKPSGAHICIPNKCLPNCPFLEPIKEDEDAENEIKNMNNIIALRKFSMSRKKKVFESL